MTPETTINPDIVREFYANAMPDCDKKEMDARFSYTSYVRGVPVRFDRDAISTYLGDPLELDPPEDPAEPALSHPPTSFEFSSFQAYMAQLIHLLI